MTLRSRRQFLHDATAATAAALVGARGLGAAAAQASAASFSPWKSRIGLEGSAGYGAGAARYLLAAGEAALEVPPQLSNRERIRTRRAGKSACQA